MPSPTTQDNSQQWAPPFKQISRRLTTITDNRKSQWSPIYPLNFWLCVLILSLVKFASTILLSYPWPKLLVAAVCRYHYESDIHNPHEDPPNEVCAGGEVTMHFESMANLLSISSSLAGLVPAFPLWCFYLSPLFFFLGGGPIVTSTLVYSAISNSVKPRQRTIAFSFLEAFSGMCNFFEPALKISTMTNPLWLSFTLTLIIHVLCFIPVCYFTEDNNASAGEDLPLETGVFRGEAEALLGSNNTPGREAINWSRSIIRRPFSKLTILIISFFCFFVVNFTTGSLGFSFSWIFWHIPEVWSNVGWKPVTMSRFILTVQQIDLLTYLRAIVVPLLFLVMIPLTTRQLDRTWHFANRDLILSASGIILAAVGTLFALFAPNFVVVVVAFVITLSGSVMSVALRSFVASNIEDSFSGRLFAGISVTETISSLVGASIMHSPNAPDGRPFIISLASFSLVGGLLVWLARKV
ncbi:hypothetical protein BKA59DRAFT_67234 [Fusarium tricinctum]|uniref:MFS transporter n=1 Tax=Fusarium tricinctum TaxID=61284 RepID=A0A8K0WFQ6_9HYPO|nr:hypothetical protein BKA59DRAFT_67234 [Fusarium tricinctum]